MTKYNVVAVDYRYYATEGEKHETVYVNVPLAFARKERDRIRKANAFGTAWVEDKKGNTVK